MTHAQVQGARYEGSHQKGSLGSACANAGGDGHARHRRLCVLLAVMVTCPGRGAAPLCCSAEPGPTLMLNKMDPGSAAHRRSRAKRDPVSTAQRPGNDLPLKHHRIDHDAALARAVEQHRVEVETHHVGRGVQHQFADLDHRVAQRIDIHRRLATHARE
jgi:hypothetical protein